MQILAFLSKIGTTEDRIGMMSILENEGARERLRKRLHD